jgi:hypothetical protein
VTPECGRGRTLATSGGRDTARGVGDHGLDELRSARSGLRFREGPGVSWKASRDPILCDGLEHGWGLNMGGLY